LRQDLAARKAALLEPRYQVKENKTTLDEDKRKELLRKLEHQK
jgi:hypothetical protein